MHSLWSIRLINAFVFSDPEPSIINTLYEWSGICCQFGLGYFVFSFVTSSKLIIFVLFHIVTFNLFFFAY